MARSATTVRRLALAGRRTTEAEAGIVGLLERKLRRAINPISTGLTGWWLGVARRQVPARPLPAPSTATTDHESRPFTGVPSPGQWVVPASQRPGWAWLPDHGASPNLRALPRWVRVWFRTPFIDRYCYEWMWWHGGWAVLVPFDPAPPPPDGGDRETRRPRPVDPGGAVHRLLSP